MVYCRKQPMYLKSRPLHLKNDKHRLFYFERSYNRKRIPLSHSSLARLKVGSHKPFHKIDKDAEVSQFFNQSKTKTQQYQFDSNGRKLEV